MRSRAKEGWHADKRHLFQAVKTANAGPLSGILYRQNHRDTLLFGVMACDHREEPEHARLLALKGAELIRAPKNCGPMRPEPMKTCWRSQWRIRRAKKGGSCAFSSIRWDKKAAALAHTVLMRTRNRADCFWRHSA